MKAAPHPAGSVVRSEKKTGLNLFTQGLGSSSFSQGYICVFNIVNLRCGSSSMPLRLISAVCREVSHLDCPDRVSISTQSLCGSITPIGRVKAWDIYASGIQASTPGIHHLALVPTLSCLAFTTPMSTLTPFSLPSDGPRNQVVR